MDAEIVVLYESGERVAETVALRELLVRGATVRRRRGHGAIVEWAVTLASSWSCRALLVRTSLVGVPVRLAVARGVATLHGHERAVAVSVQLRAPVTERCVGETQEARARARRVVRVLERTCGYALPEPVWRAIERHVLRR